MHVELYHCSSGLKRLAREEKGSSLAARIRAVYLAVEGQGAVEIGMALGFSRRTIQNLDTTGTAWKACRIREAAASNLASIQISCNGSDSVSTRGLPLMMESVFFMPPI